MARSSAAKLSPSEDFYAAYLKGIERRLDQLETQYDLFSSQNFKFEDKVTFGLDSLDLITRGGIVPGGWYGFYGGEQSSKSTLANTVLANAVSTPVPILANYDFEGSQSSSLDYFKNIALMAGCDMSLDEFFGLKKDNKWLIRPRVRQYSADIAEKFFDTLASTLIYLPRKRFSDDQWWLVFEDTDENKHFIGNRFDRVKSKPVEGAKAKFLWVPCPHGGAQALVVVDSFAAMLPENMDGEDPKSGLAAQARMFSDNIKRVKGKMSTRLVTVLGTNQLRTKIGFVLGNPEYEPGGNALQFFSDCRIRCASRTMPSMVKGVETEEAMDGGSDLYRYVNMSTKKNKLGGIPNSQLMARLWTSSSDGEAYGYDPVYDAHHFLNETGCITGTKNKISILLPEFNNGEHTPLNWHGFKTLVLGTKQQMGEVLVGAGIDLANFQEFTPGKEKLLNQVCRKYLKSGEAEEWYYQVRVGAVNQNVDQAEEEEAS